MTEAQQDGATAARLLLVALAEPDEVKVSVFGSDYKSY